MTNKEILNQLTSEMDTLVLERKQLIDSKKREKNIIKFDLESTLKLQGIDLKIKSLREQIGEISQIVTQEEHEQYGYTVFGITVDDGITTTVSKVIPYSLKEKYMEEFNVLNSPSLPNILLIEKFLEKNG